MTIIRWVLYIIAMASMFMAGKTFTKDRIYDILGDAVFNTDLRVDNARGRIEAIREVFDKVVKI